MSVGRNTLDVKGKAGIGEPSGNLRTRISNEKRAFKAESLFIESFGLAKPDFQDCQWITA
jgi:hypothetical protein